MPIYKRGRGVKLGTPAMSEFKSGATVSSFFLKEAKRNRTFARHLREGKLIGAEMIMEPSPPPTLHRLFLTWAKLTEQAWSIKIYYMG